MNDFINSNIRKIYRYFKKEKKYQIMIKMSIAISTMGLMVILYYLRRHNRYILAYSNPNIGFLGLIKHDINSHNKGILRKNFSYPNGITNFGNNCYINVLLHVKSHNY
jgi:hypothetical protein